MKNTPPAKSCVISLIAYVAVLWGAVDLRSQSNPAATDKEVIQLSPFNVRSEKDYGYRKTNATTATRIGSDIINTPLNINVVSGELIDDLSIRQIGETMNYVSGAITDKIFPDGNFIRMRGQPIGDPFRNGFRRPLSNGTDNIERVEVIKGPSTVFFGEGNPGGIVNYITKKPELRSAAQVEYSFGSYQYNKAKIDAQGKLGDNAGFRVISSYEDSNNWMDFTYNRVKYVDATFLFKPTSDLEVLLEYEIREQKQNDGFMNLTSNRQYHADWENPPADIQNATGLSAAQLRSRWLTNSNNWAQDVEKARGTRPFRIDTNVNDYTPRGIRFNNGGPDYYRQLDANTFSAETKYHAAEWFDLRYAFNHVKGEYDEAAAFSPLQLNADKTVQLNRLSGRPYEITDYTHQLDLYFNHTAGWGKNTLLVGMEHNRSKQTRYINLYDYSGLAPTMDRNGNTLTGINIYRFWDYLHDPIRLSEICMRVVSASYETNDATRNAYYNVKENFLMVVCIPW
ncbi:MAG: TonB-dependent receptor [Opitutaceae bacterium]|nr:TonB-dependent receptor [Opitutaceae bacterium]